MLKLKARQILKSSKSHFGRTVVVAQLVVRLLTTPKIGGSHPVIDNFIHLKMN